MGYREQAEFDAASGADEVEREARKARELTDDEAFTIRKAAVLCGWKLGEGAMSTALHGIADAHEAPPCCEGCSEPATRTDSEGVHLCDECMANLFARQALKVGQVWQYTDPGGGGWTRDRITKIDGTNVYLVEVEQGGGWDALPSDTAEGWDARSLMDSPCWKMHADVEPAEVAS